MAARQVRLAAILVSGKKRTCERFVGLPVQRIAEQPEHDVPQRARTAPELIPAAGLLLHPFDALHPGVEQDERSVNWSTSRKHIRKNDCILKMCHRFIVFSHGRCCGTCCPCSLGFLQSSGGDSFPSFM